MTFVEHVRLLSCEFEIRTNSREITDRLSLITPRAEQHVPVVEHCTVKVDWTGDEFRIDIDGVNEDFELSVTSALEALYQALHRRAIAALPDHIRITAAIGIQPGSAFLLVGPERAGKTTLALSLILEDIEIIGDQLALLRDGEALAFPRKFYAREETLSLLQKLRRIDKFRGCISNPQEGRVVALDPVEFGAPWRIAPAPVSTILYIEPNFGGRSTLRPSGKLEMVRRVLPHCAPPLSGRNRWLSDLTTTIDRAETFLIEFGDVDAAVASVAELLR